ncbi:hypothetical protein, partial [Xanthomonas perforans]
ARRAVHQTNRRTRHNVYRSAHVGIATSCRQCVLLPKAAGRAFGVSGLIIAATCMRWPQVGSDGCAQAGPHVAHGLCLALRPSLVRLAVRLIALPIRQARAA